MKNFIAKLACALLGLALIVGCQSTDSNKAAMTSPGKVTILFGKPAKAYTDVATVSALKIQPGGDTWQNALQKQAAGLGADAVLVDTSTLNNNTSTMVSGKAIRYQ